MLKWIACAMLIACANVAQAQVFLADDFAEGLNGKRFDTYGVGRDAAVVHGVLQQNSAELGWNQGMVEHHELWLQNGPIVETQESFETTAKVKLLWAHECAEDRNEFLAITLRGNGLKVVGKGAYKQAVLQNGVSLVVHASGLVQIVEVKNGKVTELAKETAPAFARGGRVNWYAIEFTDNGNSVTADITNAYLQKGKRIASVTAQVKTKFNPKANKVYLCNRQLNEGEAPGNNSWVRQLAIESSKASLASLSKK